MHPYWGSAARRIALLQPELIDAIAILRVSARVHVCKQQPLSHAEVEKLQLRKCPSPVQCRHIGGRASHARPRVFVGADCAGMNIGRIALETIGIN